MSAEAATETAPAIDSMKVFMGSLEKSLGRSLQPLEKISKQMGSSKFGKNLRQMGKAFKGMAAASVNAWAMEQLMKLIEPFMKLLKLLEIPINVLSALLTIMVNEIFVDLIPFFIQFSMLLLELTPTFKMLGQIISWLIINGIGVLINFIKLLGVELTPMFNEFKAIGAYLGKELTPIWQGFLAFLKGFGNYFVLIFTPLWVGIKNAFTILKTAWDESGGKLFGKDGLIAKGFETLFNVAKSIVNGVLGSFNNIIVGINDVIGLNLATIPLLAKGGIATSPTLAMIGEEGSEAVVPLDRAGEFGMGNKEMITLLEENNKIQKQLLSLLRDKARFTL